MFWWFSAIRFSQENLVVLNELYVFYMYWNPANKIIFLHETFTPTDRNALQACNALISITDPLIHDMF